MLKSWHFCLKTQRSPLKVTFFRHFAHSLLLFFSANAWRCQALTSRVFQVRVWPNLLDLGLSVLVPSSNGSQGFKGQTRTVNWVTLYLTRLFDIPNWSVPWHSIWCMLNAQPYESCARWPIRPVDRAVAVPASSSASACMVWFFFSRHRHLCRYSTWSHIPSTRSRWSLLKPRCCWWISWNWSLLGPFSSSVHSNEWIFLSAGREFVLILIIGAIQGSHKQDEAEAKSNILNFI